MLIPIISFIVVALALGCVGWIVARHWKDIRLLDPDSIREERLKREREKVIQRRFERLHADRLASVQRMGRQIGKRATEAYRRTYRKLQSLDSVYKSVTAPLTTMAPSQRERMKTLLSEARSLMRDLKWADAERRCLDVLSMDPRHTEAYRLLGQLYLKQKLYPQAGETFEYLVKTRKADDATYAGLADIAEASGDRLRVEVMRLKAVEAGPRQAYRQAEVASFYLAAGDAERAWPYAERAAKLESGSAKYLELSLEAAILLGDRNEAEARYRKLRLLSDDPQRFQAWKEKLETLPKKASKKMSREV